MGPDRVAVLPAKVERAVLHDLTERVLEYVRLPPRRIDQHEFENFQLDLLHDFLSNLGLER